MKKGLNAEISVNQKQFKMDPKQFIPKKTTDLSHGDEYADTDSMESKKKMKAYIGALNEYRYKMSDTVEDIIKSLDASKEDMEKNNITVRKKTTEGNPSNIMECGIPLVVEQPLIHDASHIVNDAFREHLCRELTGNKRMLFDSTEFKEHLSLIEEIRRAEKDVMEAQERLLKAGDIRSTGRIDLNPWNVEKFSLLCLRTFVDVAHVDEKGTPDERDGLGDSQRSCRGYGMHSELRRLRLRLNKERPRLTVGYCSPRFPRKFTTTKKPEDPVCLSVNPNIVRFDRFEPGGVYKKTVFITNSGKRLASFGILVRGGGSTGRAFDYHYAPAGPLAAGMSAKLTVTFHCTSAEDVFGSIAVTAGDGQKTNVLVCAEHCESPTLEYIAESYEMTDAVVQGGPMDRDSSSAICVFDCNACLVGAAKTVSITVKNIGRPAKFVFVPENVWYTKSVKDIEWAQSMTLDAFKITPSIFEINHEQSISISITFEPRLPVFYCSRFIIVSNNSCAHELNVFGDGQTFTNGVWLEGQGLLQSPATDGSYVLDMGKIGEVARYVYAKNTSRIKYPYRWIINHGIVSPGAKNATVNFNIHPSTGTLDKLSNTEFRVECRFADDGDAGERHAGEYRATATMMIDGIPKASINNQDVFFEEQEDSPETLSIRVAVIEVISEHKGRERLSLRTEPVIVDLNQNELWTDLCVEETVDFIVDGGLCPAVVSWVPESGGCARVEPEQFSVTDRTMVRVLIEPVRAGRLRETLKFRAVDCDGDETGTTVYVRGTVDRKPEVLVRSPAVAPLGAVCAGRPESYAVGLRVTAASPFAVQRRLYEFDGDGDATWSLRDLGDAVSYGPYETGSAAVDLGGPVTLTFQTPVTTEAYSTTATGGVSCQLAEWSVVGSAAETRPETEPAIAYTQSVTYAAPPDVRLNVDVVDIAECLYKGVPHTCKGLLRVCNNTRCELVYAWGTPIGSDADHVHCAFEPSAGTVEGNASAEFAFTVTANTAGHFEDCYIPFFVQCDAVGPQQIRVRWRAEGFSATISYEDLQMGGLYSVTWRDEPEDREQTAKWSFGKRPVRDVLLRSPAVAVVAEAATEAAGRVSDHAVMAFEDVECNTDDESLGQREHCSLWLDPADARTVDGRDELDVSVWALATAWGQYEDTVTIEIVVGDFTLPAVCVPIVVTAVTFPVEFPQAADVGEPTVNLYSMDSKQRLHVSNNSEIPIQVTWRTYNKSEKNSRPFGVVYDTSTSDDPDLWSLKINRFHGLETPRYFMIKPVILKLNPREQGFVTLFLNRSKEISMNRDENNKTYGKAVGTVTALQPPGKHCTRDDGFKLKPAVVKLCSETRHSIQPTLVLRELDNSFQISATQIYESRKSQYGIVSRWFSMLNLLRYPANVTFEADSPFVVKTLKTLRCGICPGNTSIRVFYEDLIQIELQAKIAITKIMKPVMPTKLAARKIVQVGHLYATCELGYYKPKKIASFEVHVHFPVLILSTDHVDFGQVILLESKSVDVTLSSYPGPERFTVRSGDDAFTASPARGVTTSHGSSAVTLTITFRPEGGLTRLVTNSVSLGRIAALKTF